MNYLRKIFTFCLLVALSGCYSLPQRSGYKGPLPLPDEVLIYYTPVELYSSFEKFPGHSKDPRFEIYLYKLKTYLGDVLIDYFKSNTSPSDDQAIIVFPVLGGRPVVEGYFAKYFAAKGFDTFIIRRNNEFKKPEYFDRLEQLFRENLIKDRIAISFLEKELGKKQFASFGISRGAINAAALAGIDKRLKYNVLVLGGTNISELFRKSDQRGIRRYLKNVIKLKGLEKNKILAKLTESIQSDPKNLASYIDSRNTLMILGAFDQTVPIKLGRKLRDQIGGPRTIFLLGNHYTSLLFTSIQPLFPPRCIANCILPFDYVESEALLFYHRAFKTRGIVPALIPYRILSIPFEILGRVYEGIFY
ncbi:MAG TPA: hypothetical protein PKD37_06875 [Oligoflexia bacterium]|nr:hypothetical protein [Oligoflexia bacterium]HMP27686.1 hypothetical protein [Oligoflexia bacterium]